MIAASACLSCDSCTVHCKDIRPVRSRPLVGLPMLEVKKASLPIAVLASRFQALPQQPKRPCPCRYQASAGVLVLAYIGPAGPGHIKTEGCCMGWSEEPASSVHILSRKTAPSCHVQSRVTYSDKFASTQFASSATQPAMVITSALSVS